MLSEHFKRSEFACKCGCGFDTVDHELIVVLEDVRVWACGMTKILSGCRCNRHNETVGGSTNSQHKLSKAADIVIRTKTPKEIYEYLDERYPNKYGIGNYGTFTHIDTRTNKARW
jgi:uncharacterized protein YcbK (DUF882 family)